MSQSQLNKMKTNKGFIAALDQSGGSTPKALHNYGITEDAFSSEKEMFDLVHEMRTRIITSSAFNSDHIIGAILFEQTMDRKIEDMYTADYLIEKGIVPFLKVDKGLDNESDGVQMMKPINNLDDMLKHANKRHIFGTKMRSVIKKANPQGIKRIVEQQFEIGKQIIAAGLVPIIEPEVDIHSAAKEKCEEILQAEILHHLSLLKEDELVMLKLTLPTRTNLYKSCVDHPNVIRVVALSGGYSTDLANAKLEANDGVIASFSRALTQDLQVDQTEQEFNTTLEKAVKSIYEASL